MTIFPSFELGVTTLEFLSDTDVKCMVVSKNEINSSNSRTEGDWLKAVRMWELGSGLS